MYAHIVELNLPIDQAIETLKAALAENKMGIVSEVNVQAIMRDKLDHHIQPYRLLGICSPGIAKRVLDADHDAGALLPCGCCAYEVRPGVTRIAMQTPSSIAQLAGNTEISAAMEIGEQHLAHVIAKLKG